MAPGPRTSPEGTAARESTAGACSTPASGESLLWRVRTTVDDVPGTLAALCGAMARLRIDILTLQTHPLPEGSAVDEFLLRTPAELSPNELTDAIAEAGGRDTWMERADTHDLVDAPTRMLTLATRTALDAAELPLALRGMLGRCTVRSLPADRAGPITEDLLDGTTMVLRDPSSGGSITVSRPYLPFTPAEFARARALVTLDARLGPRLPSSRHVLTLPAGNEIEIRRAGPRDIGEALAMHERCSTRTLARRYHGPVKDAGRYLKHLLSPRFGRTLAAQTADGRIVALGHLLWDGEETEVALLVEDAWQGRGIGLELLRRLVAMAESSGCTSVYAITQSDNTGMVASMRKLNLPLDYQVEGSTLVITAQLAGAAEDLSSSRSGTG